jgi:hypothetical protein
MKHVCLMEEVVLGYSGLEGTANVEYEIFEAMEEGKSVAKKWPKDAYAQIPKWHGKKAKVGDLFGTWHHLMGSARFKELFSSLAGKKAKIEYLPVEIRDVQGKPFDGSYFMLHVLDEEDIINVKASKGVLNPDGLRLSSWKKLVVKPGKGAIFRPRRLEKVVMVPEEIGAKLLAAEPKLIGLQIRDIETLQSG